MQTWKWSRGLIAVAMRKQVEPSYVLSWVLEGLAVHPGVKESGYSITHVESGLRLPGRCTTLAEAKIKAEQLLCIEGLWSNPLEAFAGGLREVDCKRMNDILGTSCEPNKVSSDVKRALARRVA